jgi:hypothetical protein
MLVWVFWVVRPCRLVVHTNVFGGAYCLHPLDVFYIHIHIHTALLPSIPVWTFSVPREPQIS